MSKRAAAGVGVAVVLLIALGVCIFETSWDEMNESGPQPIDYGTHDSGNTDSILDEDDDLNPNSLNYVIFEEYGPLLIVLAVLMFGAMVGGICIAREEDDCDDSD